MSLNYSRCPAADQQDEAKKARTKRFFELTEKKTTTDAQLARLVEQGVCLEARDNGGDTALHYAAIYGHTATLQALLAAGAESEARDVWGDTALHCAAINDRTATAQALLAAGAEIEVRDVWGNTPLHWAASNGHTATAWALLASGAESEARDNRGRTALILAAWNGHTGILQDLLARGANIYAQANNGKRPIDEPVVSTYAESLQRGYAKFVASGKPPQNTAAVYRLLAATPLLDERAPVDRLGNLT
ncbi:MAG: ankyrin repeat domain-containing protein, partial [Alphaproteobacteria bacterium]